MKRASTALVQTVILFMVFSSVGFAGPTSYLPEKHRVYDFLERMEHQFFVSGTKLGTRPMTRASAASLVYELHDHINEMSKVDAEELACLLDEFRGDYFGHSAYILSDKGPLRYVPGILGKYVYRNRRNLYMAHDDTYSLYIDPVVIKDVSLGKLHGSGDDDTVITETNGVKIRGTIGDHFGYHIDVRDAEEWGSRDYPEATATTMTGRGFASFKGDHAEFDETRAHIAWSQGPFILSFGRGQTIWGRGRSGTLAFSGYGAPYDMFRFETSFGRLKFLFFTAELEQYPPIAQFYYDNPEGAADDSVTVQKRLTGHRIEVDVADRLSIGLYEAVVYGGRWDWSYLNPVMFLKGAEHANGDHDNAMLGADFRWIIHKYHSIYGEFFADDITTSKIGKDWYGNKFAWQIGSYLVHPFGLTDVDVRMEYTRIDPWVYTHRYPINSATHYGDVFGSPLGPNSDEIFGEIRKRFTRRFQVSMSAARRRHGANPPGKNVGGDPLEGYRKGDPTDGTFLAGDVEGTTLLSFDVSYELFWQLFLRAGYTREELDGDGINFYHFSFCLHEW